MTSGTDNGPDPALQLTVTCKGRKHLILHQKCMTRDILHIDRTKACLPFLCIPSRSEESRLQQRRTGRACQCQSWHCYSTKGHTASKLTRQSEDKETSETRSMRCKTGTLDLYYELTTRTPLTCITEASTLTMLQRGVSWITSPGRPATQNLVAGQGARSMNKQGSFEG